MQLKDPALEVAESYGLLAKAFKRLKKVEGDPVRRQCYAELARAYKKLRARAQEDDQPPATQFVLPYETAEAYMATQRVLWGLNFDTKLCEHLCKRTVRADRFKNRWLADPNARRGWRSISSIEFSRIFNMVQVFHADCLALFEKYTTMEEWLDKVCDGPAVGPPPLHFERGPALPEAVLHLLLGRTQVPCAVARLTLFSFCHHSLIKGCLQSK